MLGGINSFEDLLKKMENSVPAQTYALYIQKEAKPNSYHLKVLRQQAPDSVNVRPSYSGLLGYQQQVFRPPLILSVDSLPLRAEIIQEGGVQLLVIPFPLLKGLIRIGPVKENRRLMSVLESLNT
jgi:hypothetical protein